MAQEPYSALPSRTTAPNAADYFPCNNTTSPGGVTTVRQSIAGLLTGPTIQAPTITGGVTVTSGGADITGNVSLSGGLVATNVVRNDTATGGFALGNPTSIQRIAYDAATGFNFLTAANASASLVAHAGTFNGPVTTSIGVVTGSVKQLPSATTSVPLEAFTTIAILDNNGPAVSTVFATDGTSDFVDVVAWSQLGTASILSGANLRGPSYNRGYNVAGGALQMATFTGGASGTVTVKVSTVEGV